jgi:Haem-binding domain
MARRLLRRVVLPVGLVLLVIQLVPYGWSHPNPPARVDAAWPSERAETLARASCYDCHSNQTKWPVYSYVAPMSWLVRRDVENGRAELNFSQWDQDREEAGDAAEAIQDGSMPPQRYTVLHPSARLSETERAELVAALNAMEEGDRAGGTDRDRRGSNRGPG